MSAPTKGMVAGKAIQTGAQTKEWDEGFERTFGPKVYFTRCASCDMALCEEDQGELICGTCNALPPEQLKQLHERLNDEERRRKRGRFVYTSNGSPLPEPIQVGEEWRNPGHCASLKSEEEVYGSLGTATDGTRLDTRKRHREYMKANNLTIDTDFKGTWEKAAEYRERMSKGDFDHHSRRETIARAAYEVEKKGRR